MEDGFGKPVQLPGIRRVHCQFPPRPCVIQGGHIGQGFIQTVGKDSEAGKAVQGPLGQKGVHLCPQGTVDILPRGQPEAAVRLHGIVGQRALGGRGIAPGPAAPQVFERVPLIEPVEAVHQIGLLSGQLPPCFRLPCLAQGEELFHKGMYMGQLRLGEQAVQLPKLGGGQRIGGGIFHRYTRGCGKLLRLFAASQEKQGEQRQEGAALDHGITSVLDYFRHCTTGR